MLAGKRIILGITGGIAAYKAAILLRDLQKADAEVRCCITPAAQQFVGRQTFAALSGHDVPIHIFPENCSTESWTRHIQWGEWADAMLIAPCTANTLAKIAGGISDNMLTATVLAARCPLLLCPTMDGEMYHAPAVQRNITQIKTFGYHLLEPEKGYLASGQTGKGRLPESTKILESVAAIIDSGDEAKPLKGKKVLVTAGPTREFIDPVRFISNPSSGKMGIAMAQAAYALGADVTLLHGPISEPLPRGITTHAFESASELFEQVKQHAHSDIIIMAAAVADFTPTNTASQKLKKANGKPDLSLTNTTDILAWLGTRKKENQTLIGFAMETQNEIENGRQKRRTKKADWIAANSIGNATTGFGSDQNTIQLIGADSVTEFSGPKTHIARQMLGHIFGT